MRTSLAPILAGVAVLGTLALAGCSTQTQNPVALKNTIQQPDPPQTIVILPGPSIPTLSSPANGSTGISVSPVLVWNASTGATGYHVEASADSLFASIAVNDSGISSTTLNLTNLAYGTTYFWRVKASSATRSSAWSTVWRFTTVPPPCAQPTVTAAASKTFLWPPNRKMVLVTFSGIVTNNCAGATYTLTDSYGLLSYSGALANEGPYSVTLSLQAWRKGSDKKGRVYTFNIVSTNSAGAATASATVLVPHEKHEKEDDDQEETDD